LTGNPVRRGGVSRWACFSLLGTFCPAEPGSGVPGANMMGRTHALSGLVAGVAGCAR
jgi:hypothetical protein